MVLGKSAGVLLGRSGGADAVDAAIVCLASDGDEMLTPDADNLHPLAEAAGVQLELIPVRDGPRRGPHPAIPVLSGNIPR